ncbi:hypothetical protein MGYG_06960 [Nannizzia gypsea CBS 118893]|uniref:Uncharacterized protein n=1 Tax=Arthroderma gypseum (strain ATCC MYA-4604 / CBS 118893) TaxID=535722 RepID=E4V1P5_ARTGP|nr:hypothetical protein MGYG_06960 [Nannizzia gypsea CBS 118893]EFR03960.1 hypothetical protein MGYG_06960 [Nannizzia gypsea CBS 118893]
MAQHLTAGGWVRERTGEGIEVEKEEKQQPFWGQKCLLGCCPRPMRSRVEERNRGKGLWNCCWKGEGGTARCLEPTRCSRNGMGSGMQAEGSRGRHRSTAGRTPSPTA